MGGSDVGELRQRGFNGCAAALQKWRQLERFPKRIGRVVNREAGGSVAISNSTRPGSRK